MRSRLPTSMSNARQLRGKTLAPLAISRRLSSAIVLVQYMWHRARQPPIYRVFVQRTKYSFGVR